MRRLVGLAAAALLVLASGCTGDDDDAAETTTSASAPESTSTTTTASSQSSSTTTSIDQRCAPRTRPEGVAASEVTGDADGDGRSDTVVVYGTGSEASPAPWRIRVELASGGTIEADIPDADAVAGAQALGTSPLAGPEGDVLFVKVGAGASAAIVGVWLVRDCELVRLAGPGGSPSQFAVGGSVTHLAGLACVEGRLIALAATSADGSSYDTSETELIVQGDALVVNGQPLTGTLAPDDPGLARYASIDCPNVASP
ncbi:MAG: hypothetical protein ACRD0U_14000 [Acidimicrobiales bacterium]